MTKDELISGIELSYSNETMTFETLIDLLANNYKLIVDDSPGKIRSIEDNLASLKTFFWGNNAYKNEPKGFCNSELDAIRRKYLYNFEGYYIGYNSSLKSGGFSNIEIPILKFGLHKLCDRTSNELALSIIYILTNPNQGIQIADNSVGVLNYTFTKFIAEALFADYLLKLLDVQGESDEPDNSRNNLLKWQMSGTALCMFVDLLITKNLISKCSSKEKFDFVKRNFLVGIEPINTNYWDRETQYRQPKKQKDRERIVDLFSEWVNIIDSTGADGDPSGIL